MNSRRSEAIEFVLARCRGSLLAVAFFSLFINLYMLAAPLYVLQVFDRVLTTHSRETLFYLTVISGLALITFGLLEGVRAQILVRLSSWVDRSLSGPVLQNSIAAALPGLGNGSIQGLRDLSVCGSFLSGPAILPILDVPWTPIFVAVVFILHPMLGWMALSGALLLVVLIAVSELATRRLINESSAQSMRLLDWAGTSVRNADAVEAMGMGGNLLRKWERMNGQSLDLRERANGRAGEVKALTRSIRMFLQIAIIGLGAWLVLDQELTPGGMIAGSILFGRAMAPIDQAIGSWRSVIAAREAYRRLTEILAGVSLDKKAFKLPRPDGYLQVDGVTFAHPGDREPCLRYVRFELRPGETLGIVGPTASGKTTLARLLIGNLVPLGGRVLLDGVELSSWDREDLGRHIGYLPQDVELLDGSVHANIARMHDEENEGVIAAARLAEVHEAILGLRNGYDTQIGKEGVALSGGQSQRIALARALFSNPKFVVLDEPNANLDQDGENALARTLLRLREHAATTVVITHRLWLLRHVDKILVLRNGNVEAFGSRDEVLAKIARPASPRVVEPSARSGLG